MVHDSAPYLFCPRYNYRQIVQIMLPKVLPDDVGWMQQADESVLMRQSDVLSGFLKDSSRTQFIDFDGHPFMRDEDLARTAEARVG